jgi:hypothetical protein
MLELLLEVGIIGIMIIGPWLFKILKKLRKVRASEQGIYYNILLVMLALTSICVSTMTDYFQYWLFLGLIISYIRELEKNMKEKLDCYANSV